jgi:peptidoglycan/xylan/chitin deacetylase (PgdA/CDA1 family)
MSDMDRRRFFTWIGVFGAGGVTGAAAVAAGITGAGATPGESPTARTAVPDGPQAYTTTVTFRTAPSAKVIALTIDDGPTREWTPQVLAILRRHGARATFFRVGKRAQAAPELVVQTAAEGHEQGNHTWAHDDLTQHDLAVDFGTLYRTHRLLTDLTGRAPALCRPPYGRVDSVGLSACARLHYGIALWSAHVTGSYASNDVSSILGRVSAGSIILAHDGGPEPSQELMTQLDRLVAALTDRGYVLVTVSELLAEWSPGAAAHLSPPMMRPVHYVPRATS